jgi:8-amino-7-oxononanoate synthase
MPKRVQARLTSREKAALLSRMREDASAVPPAPARYDTSFTSLPGFAEFQVYRAAGDMLGLDNPFYRPHEAKAGATTAINGRQMINFASYDYLGLNGHPQITAAVDQAVRQWGTSVSASRITAGERPFHRELEQDLANLYGCESALTFVSGHATNIATISSLVGPSDLVVHDALMHNSVVVGAKLSGAQRRSFAHNDYDELERTIAGERHRYKRALIVTEGLFSMDGDIPDIHRLIDIKKRHGAWLMIDDAHGLGVLGTRGFGLAELASIDPRSVDIWMGTLSKALASCGGYIAGPQPLVDYLKYAAPGMVYSVGLSPPAAVAAREALALLRNEPSRVERLRENGQRFLLRAKDAGLDVGTSAGYAIVPIILGDSLKTVVLTQRLSEHGINVCPIIPPAVQERSARLRFFITAEHDAVQIDRTVDVVRSEIDSIERDGISLDAIGRLRAAKR